MVEPNPNNHHHDNVEYFTSHKCEIVPTHIAFQFTVEFSIDFCMVTMVTVQERQKLNEKVN